MGSFCEASVVKISIRFVSSRRLCLSPRTSSNSYKTSSIQIGGGGGIAVRGGVGGMGMVPVQVPVSVSNGHTVYQTVHLPVHAPQHLQIIPQLQQVR